MKIMYSEYPKLGCQNSDLRISEGIGTTLGVSKKTPTADRFPTKSWKPGLAIGRLADSASSDSFVLTSLRQLQSPTAWYDCRLPG
jgi:hypothetical protein